MVYPLPYGLNCFWDKSYIRQTLRHLKTRIKEHLPTCVVKFIEKEPKIMTIATENATKISSVADNLVNNKECSKNYDLSRFKILHQKNLIQIKDLVTITALISTWK